MIRNTISTLFLLLLIHSNTNAQLFKWLKVKNDTTYITDLTKDLTVRVFGANKFAKYAPGDYKFNNKLSYAANANYNLGLGFQYKYLGANISFKMPFINDDSARYGKTKSLDLQSYLYLRKFTIDLYYLSYKGYYISDRNILTSVPVNNIFPKRPDLRTRNVSINTQYIFNNEKFSFRAAFLQNEYQKKSAGSIIAGAGVNYINVSADSAIIPANIKYDGYFSGNTFTGSSITSLGINAGYAYTVVILSNYFMTASMQGGAGFNYSTLTDKPNNKTSETVSFQFNTIIRIAAGYNSTNYFVGIQHINFANRNNTPVPLLWQQFQTGSTRLTFAKRIKLRKDVRKKINEIENNIKTEMGIQSDTTEIR